MKNIEVLKAFNKKLLDIVNNDPICDQVSTCAECPYNNGYDHELNCWNKCDLSLLQGLIEHMSVKDGTHFKG